jgi:hypothetical protein
VVTVRQAINAAIVASANDAAVALAEKMAGSEEAFAARMTAMARELGMARTVFRNASGLPHDGQVTTARDRDPGHRVPARLPAALRLVQPAQRSVGKAAAARSIPSSGPMTARTA